MASPADMVLVGVLLGHSAFEEINSQLSEKF